MHVILVHGAGGSAATWSLVAPELAARGIRFSLADNPSQSLREDVSAVSAMIDAIEGPVLLVGHSYGGAVITNAGVHERVRGLVYIAAFAPDIGESVQGIVNSYPAALVNSFMMRADDGAWIPDERPEARQALAWDVPAEVWARRHDDHRVSADAIFTATTEVTAWSSRPSWYLIATQDRHIRVEAQRDMAARAGANVSEVPTSHAVPHAAAQRVAALIDSAVADLSMP